MSEANIYQRINAVRKAVGYIRKDKEVQGYRAVTHDMVTAAIRQHLLEHGVVIVPTQRESSITEIGQTKGGATMIRYAGWYSITFVNIDKPEEGVTVDIEAHANDQGDKAPGKAISYATKYAILKLFSLETGEDEESRVEHLKPVARISEDKQAELLSKIDETGSDLAKFLKWLGASDLYEVTEKQYERGMTALKRKEQEAAKEAPNETA